MSFGVFGVFIIARVLAAQFFFSTRNNMFWGSILPIGYIAVVTWMLVTNRIESVVGYVLILLLGMVFLIAEWNEGRKEVQEKGL